MRRLGRVLALEDLLWAAWLAVLRPASGGLFLEDGVWAPRYLWAVAAALLGALVLEPLWAGR